MKITKIIANNLAKEFNINLKIVPFDEWLDGLNIELEHGKKVSKITNITNDDVNLTARIVISHLQEDPRYYKYLKAMEQKREKYWATKNKPNIFNK